jgi:cytochrome oxidase Cu insertion factor (SCO1/SenC/PrrC family)
MRNWRIWLILASVMIAGEVAYFYSTSFINSDSYEGTELSGKAPDFRLMDQHGDLVSLSDFKGKVVVLTFFDSQCQDVCPLTAAASACERAIFYKRR